MLATDHCVTKVPVCPRGVAVETNSNRKVKNDRDGKHVVITGECDEPTPRLGLDIGRIHDREVTGIKAFAGNEVQYLECCRGRALVVFIARHQTSAEVTRDDLECTEVGLRERRLPGTTRPDKADQ
jgi:hypothetical protein